MKNKIENILKNVCVLSGGNASYIIKFSKNGIEILSSYGFRHIDEPQINAFNKLITRKKEPSLSEIKKASSYHAISKENNFKSFYKKKFWVNNGSSYYMVVFSENKMPTAKTLQNKLIHEINFLIQELTSKRDNKPKLPEAKNPNHENSKVNITNTSINEIASCIHPVLYSLALDDMQYLYISETVRSLFGYSPEDIYQNKFIISRSINKNFINDFNSFIDKLREGEYAAVEYKMMDRFSKEHWMRHSGTPIFKNGKLKRVVGIIEDVSDFKVVETKLKSTEERFELLVDTVDDFIFILNGFGYFSLVNKNGSAALGYSPDEIIGRHFLEFIDKEDESKITDAFNQILNSNSVTTFETNFLDRFDKKITFEIHAKALIADGEISGMISIGRNITQRKLDDQKIRDLNSKLIEANRIISIERERARHKIGVLEELNKLKSEFISNISHELRTPLASIVGFAETISSDPDIPKETLKEFSGIILSEGKRLAKLINDILDFSRLEAGEEELRFELFNLVDIINDVIASFETQLKEKELVLTKEDSQDTITITGDKKRIKQVVSNLISNSIKFTNPGGRISILASDYGKEIEFVVSDTGIGIPEKDLPKLFQKFSKIQRPGAPIAGTGFGLVGVKQIVDLHKGYIRVTSQENKGTTFIIRLPKQQLNRG